MAKERFIDGRWIPVESEDDLKKRDLESRIKELEEKLARHELPLEEEHRLFVEKGKLEQRLGISESDEDRRNRANPNRGLGNYL